MLVVGLSKFHFFSAYSSVVGVGCGTKSLYFQLLRSVFDREGSGPHLLYDIPLPRLLCDCSGIIGIRQNSFFLTCDGERSLLVVCVTHCLFYSALL